MEQSERQLVHLAVSVNGDFEGERATESARELYAELKKHLPDALERREGVDDKGDPVTLLALGIAVASSPVLVELIKCVRDWLSRRPRERKIVVKGADDREIITVDAQNVNDAAVIAAIEAATARSGS